MKYAAIATSLSEQLSLEHPPVALAFVKEPPPGIRRTDTAVPAGCAFWQRAESEVFYAAAEDHFRCPVGAMVMGFPLPPAQMQELQETVEMMCGLSYVRPEEMERIPKVTRPAAGIVYGPLARFPLEPDVVLLWVTPQQAMVMSECCGLINWAGSAAAIHGRPGCASVPLAMAGAQAAQSYGCTGMRINTGIAGQFMLLALPGTLLPQLSDDLARVAGVHAQLDAYYRHRAAGLAPAMT
jgi:uncharacterized protein (DUF169 family)